MESYLTDPRHDETQSPEERDASDDTRIAVQTGTIESEDGEIVLPTYKDVTPEEFFAEGTSPLADTTSVLPAHSEYRVPYKADGNYHVPDHVGDTMKIIKVDGDRTQLTETQMVGVVDNVFDQTLTENVDFFSPATQIGALQERVYALETFNTKLLLALKQHGFDTNKHFR